MAPQCRLAFIFIYYFYMLGLCIHVTCASSFALNFSTTPTSPCGKHLQCRGDVSFANQMMELTRRNNIACSSNYSQGRVWYASPVRLCDAGTAELASFTTTFAFKITPNKSCNNNSFGADNTGDGMAFFLAPYSSADVLNSSGRGGGSLGLFNDDGDKYNTTGGGSDQVVAVEFDTYRNRWDNSGQHVGIHVNSVRSSASTNASVVGNKAINLASNVTMTATINYDNRTKILAVDLDTDGASYHVNHTVDLKSFLPEKVAVGFSAATGSSAELHRVSFWSFHSSLEGTAAPDVSSAAPSTEISNLSTSIPPVKPEPATKYFASTDSTSKVQRISISSFDSSVEQDALPPSAPTSEPSPSPTSDLPPPAPEPNPPPSDLPPPAPEPNPPASESPPPAPASQSYPPPTSDSGSSPEHNAVSPMPPSLTSNSEATTQSRFKALIASILSVTIFATVGILLWLWQKRRRNRQTDNGGTSGSNSSDEQLEEADFEKEVAGPRRFHYRELATATGNFKDENRLGTGGFGSVYKGTLPGDKQVAVKKFSPETSSQQGRKEFESEVKIIGRLRHRNLVQLLGWCDSGKGLFLVYELVSEGSLDKHIHLNPRLLTWPERYKIILGLGSALRYLHLEWEQCVVHGDIKPSNIMLDSSYNTKLGDFGLARLADHGADPRTTRNIAGTAGYVDPDLVNTRRPSTESDVYSFGIVLLEIVSAEPPVVQDPPFMLLKWVWNLHSQGKTVDAADERLRGDAADERQMERALVVGLWCVHHDPAQRPSIVDAMLVLQSEDAKLPLLPPQMYKLAARPGVVSTTTGHSGVSGSSFSSGAPSCWETTGTTRSSDSFTN